MSTTLAFYLLKAQFNYSNRTYTKYSIKQSHWCMSNLISSLLYVINIEHLNELPNKTGEAAVFLATIQALHTKNRTRNASTNNHP